MSSMSSELILRLRDGVSGPARAIDGVVQRMGRTIATAFGAKNAQGFAQGAAALRREAAEMQRSAAAMSHGTHALGTALAGIGIGHGFGEFIKAGADYRKELIALKNSGKTSDEIAHSMKAAASIATELPTQTFADSIKIINETTAAYGDLGHALENLKFNSKFESNMKSVLGDHADPHMLQNLVRALEIRGTAFNPEKYQEEAGKLGKAFAFTRGAVNPENFYDFAKNANPDIKQFSTEFLTEVVPSLIQTFQAPGAGTGLKAFEKVWRGGLTDKSQAAEWVRVGMVSAKAVQDNKGQSPGWKSGMAEYSELAKSNPFEAMGKLLEKLKAKGIDIMDSNALGLEFDKLFKNGKARAMAYELGQAVTRRALIKDAGLIRSSASMDAQYENNKDDIGKAREALKASFENLMASMSGPLVVSAAHGIWNLALGVQHLAAVLAQHPMLGATAGLVASLGAGVAGIAVLRAGFSMLGLTGIRPFKMIGAAMATMRATALASVAFMGRSFLTLLNPLALVRGAVFGIGMVIRGVAYATGIGLLVAAGAWLYENWSNVGVAFEAFRGAFMRALGPARPILQPILTDIAHLWEIVSGLIHPTDDMGAAWARAGIKLGNLLGKNVAPWARSIRNVYEAVKGLGRHWNEVVTIITSDDPIGRAVTALTPAFNRMLADLGNSIRNFDWAGAWVALRAQADPILTAFFTGMVDKARDTLASLVAFDWTGAWNALRASADPILTAFFTGFVSYAEKGAAALIGYDWGGVVTGIRGLIEPGLIKFFTGWVDYAKQGADALISYDWVGLGARIVQAIIQGIENMGGALAKAITDRLPSWMPGSTAGGGGAGGGGASIGDRARHGRHGLGGGGDSGDTTHVSGMGPRASIEGNRYATAENADAIKAAAKQLGTTPEDLATVIGYETAGTFSPSKWGGKNGAYMGLIQMGEPERRQFGANDRQTFAEQMPAVVRYLKGRGFKPGMGLLDLYSTINAGSPGHYNASDGNGTVRTHVAKMQAETAGLARAFLAKSGPPAAATAAAPSPAGTSPKAVSDADVFAARQRILNGSRNPADQVLVDAYKAQQAKPEKPAGARARGGSVAGGRPYLVGEHGWEIMTPGSGGHITPHDAIRGALGDMKAGRGRAPLHFAPNISVTLHGAHHDGASIGQAVVDSLHNELLTALDSTHSDKD